MSTDTRAQRITGALLLAFTSAVMFADLAGGGLRNGDEARYAIVAENILATGDWVTLHYLDEPYFQKSPARFWLSAALFEVAGSNAFTVRFWSALFGVGSVWLAVLVGRRLAGPWRALLAGFILATSPAYLFVHGARTGEMDTAVTFFWLAALLPLLREEPRPRDLVAAVAAAALVGLFKHLAYTPLVLLNLGLVIAVRRSWHLLRPVPVLASAAVLLLLLAPWYLAQWSLHGDLFWRVIWGRVVTGPAFAVAENSATHGRAFYAGVLWSGAWPWSLLVPLALVRLVGTARRDARALVPVLMLGVLLVLVTLSSRKLAWYALPGFAALALVLAGAARNRPGRLTAAWLAVAAVVAALVGVTSAEFVSGPAFQVDLAPQWPAAPAWGWGLGAALVVAAAGLAGRRWGRSLAAVAAAGWAVVAVAAVIGAVVPVAQPGSAPAVAALPGQINPQLPSDAAVVLGVRGDGPRDDVSLYYLRKLGGDPARRRTLAPDEAWRAATAPGFTGILVLGERQHRHLLRAHGVPEGAKRLAAGGGYVVLGIGLDAS